MKITCQFEETQGRHSLTKNGEDCHLENTATTLANGKAYTRRIEAAYRELQADPDSVTLAEIGEELLMKACHIHHFDYNVYGEGAFMHIQIVEG